jgi:hypothetical protein
MQALGTQPAVKVAMTAVQLFRDDCLVLCSDGLSNKVAPDEMCEAAGSSESLAEACRLLIQKANDRGGEDNITVILARFDGEGLNAAADGKSITGSFRALDQGYVSEFLSAQSAGLDAQPETEPQSPGQVTAVLQAPDATQLVVDEPEDEGDFHTRTTAESLTFDGQSRRQSRSTQGRQSYTLIIIFALISLLLLGATAYFFYSTYMKPGPEKVDQAE